MERPFVVSNSFDNLRSWAGSQARAFEEISYQLLKESDIPIGSRAIRTGNPDGGVEWYVPLLDGTEWGWQAKHVRGIDPLLRAMTSTVQRVVQDRPKLTKLIFVISWNLATSTSGGKHLSQRQKFENKIEAWKNGVPGAAEIKFELIQGSDLLDILSRPEHRGRRSFWFRELVLDSEWLARCLNEQVAAAGEKYRPDLQVDLPIEEDLKALGAAQSVLADLERLRRRVIDTGRDLSLTPSGPKDLVQLHRKAIQSAQDLVKVCSEVVFDAGSEATALDPLKDSLREFLARIKTAGQRELALEKERHQQAPQLSDSEKQDFPFGARSCSAQALRDAAIALDEWLESTVGRALQERLYFLIGPAGSGKTHLFIDGVRGALDDDRPAVVLFGARFGRGDLWASICDQLGLGSVGSDVLLGAMDAAGEAASTSGRRFVLLVDALNETVPPDFWVSHLPVLRAAIKHWPHIALAVSCRDTYLDLVDEGTESSRYVQRTHPGFAGREVEATHLYFKHYGLEAPRIPLLLPEFSLPLFLRLYCESLTDSGQVDAAVGHEGRVRIFERYLDAKLKRISRRLTPTAATAFELEHSKERAKKVLEALLDEFAATGLDGVRGDRAEELATNAMGGVPGDIARVLGEFQSEGILTRERLYLGGDSVCDGFRIGFQAFADYLILSRRLSATTLPMNDEDLRHWLLEDCSLGIVEAAAVSLPELYDVELPDFLGLKGNSLECPDSDNEDGQYPTGRAWHVFRSVIETLPYRAAKSVTERTIEILCQRVQSGSDFDQFFRAMITIAPQSDNLLNADAFHRFMVSIPMPCRDSCFGFSTYNELFEESSPVATLARWAASGPYPEYDPNVVELACIPLVWLLSSSNRTMRDWVTKALVQLLRGHLEVAQRLVVRFWEVDDPYVVQRTIVIAYGALMRSDPTDREKAKKLADRIRKLVFTRPVRADELMLDAARGAVEWGVANKVLPAEALADLRRPYGLAPPSTPPSAATLEKKYGFKKSQADSQSYSTIHFSVLSGDFGRYVVESGIANFSRYLCDEVDSKKGARPEQQSDEYPADRAKRWIFNRILDFGWTPQLFGSEDRSLGHSPGWNAENKSERWGKKYQWMAYHELLARLADNFQPVRHWDESVSDKWPHRIISGRDIDPSLPPVTYRGLLELGVEGSSTWGPSPIGAIDWSPLQLDFKKYGRSLDRFLSDTASEPMLDRVSFVRGEQGERWFLLDVDLVQTDPSESKSWFGLQQVFLLNTWLSPRDQARELLTHIPRLWRSLRWNLNGGRGHIDCCYAGEVGWTPYNCCHKEADFKEIEDSGQCWQLVPTVETVTWEDSLDCSISAPVFAAMPSTFVQVRANLNLDEMGPSWREATGEIVLASCSEVLNKRGKSVLVREGWLRAFLEQHDLELLVGLYFERRKLASHYQCDRSEVVYSAARIDSNLNISAAAPLRERR